MQTNPLLEFAESSYAEAVHLYHSGAVIECAAVAQEAIRALGANEVGEHSLASHASFAKLVVLLSCALAADGDYVESQRLLASAEGYVLEHLSGPRQRRIALAHVAYDRAVLLLEDSCTACNDEDASPSAPAVVVVEEARTLLEESERHLIHETDGQRLLLADVWHARGVCEEAAGRHATALEYYRKSLDVRRRFGDTVPSRGTTSLKLALTLEHIAHLYRLLPCPSKRREALHLFAVVASVRRRHLDVRHPLYRRCALAEAAAAAECGKPIAARALLHRLLEETPQLNDDVSQEAGLWLSYVEHLLKSQLPASIPTD